MGSGKGTLSRRGLLEGLAALSGLTLASGDLEALTGAGARPPAATKAKAERRGSEAERLRRAYDTRLRAARQALDAGSDEQRANGEEERLPARIGCYTKGLPHNERGEVEPKSYEFLSVALRSGDPEAFERIPLGGFTKLANPQAAWTFGLLGPDAAQIACPPAPLFASAEQAGEMVELAWQALLRDLPFAEYETSPVARSAVEEPKHISATPLPSLPTASRQSGAMPVIGAARLAKKTIERSRQSETTLIRWSFPGTGRGVWQPHSSGCELQRRLLSLQWTELLWREYLFRRTQQRHGFRYQLHRPLFCRQIQRGIELHLHDGQQSVLPNHGHRWWGQWGQHDMHARSQHWCLPGVLFLMRRRRRRRCPPRLSAAARRRIARSSRIN